MNKKQKKMLIRIIITAVMVIVLNFISITGFWQFMLYLAAYLIIGYDILKKAGKGKGAALDPVQGLRPWRTLFPTPFLLRPPCKGRSLAS